MARYRINMKKISSRNCWIGIILRLILNINYITSTTFRFGGNLDLVVKDLFSNTSFTVNGKKNESVLLHIINQPDEIVRRINKIRTPDLDNLKESSIIEEFKNDSLIVSDMKTSYLGELIDVLRRHPLSSAGRNMNQSVKKNEFALIRLLDHFKSFRTGIKQSDPYYDSINDSTLNFNAHYECIFSTNISIFDDEQILRQDKNSIGNRSVLCF